MVSFSIVVSVTHLQHLNKVAIYFIPLSYGFTSRATTRVIFVHLNTV